ncbi:MAG: hypothetical protein M0004_13635 [Actinomycetota bacterium]|nr:hypothetical protein [Actinomycetota bacterium]
MTSRVKRGGGAGIGSRRFHPAARRRGRAGWRTGGYPLIVGVVVAMPLAVAPSTTLATHGVPAAHRATLGPHGASVSPAAPRRARAQSGATVTRGTETLFPRSTTVLVGTPDSGGPASLWSEDAKTYDVRSVYVAAAGGGVTDWYATGKIASSPSAVHEIAMTYVGQFSKASVLEKVYLYNYAAHRWELFDARDVGNQDDTQVVVTPEMVHSYVSSSGELRARVEGFRAGARSLAAWHFQSWANYLSWRVS